MTYLTFSRDSGGEGRLRAHGSRMAGAGAACRGPTRGCGLRRRGARPLHKAQRRVSALHTAHTLRWVGETVMSDGRRARASRPACPCGLVELGRGDRPATCRPQLRRRCQRRRGEIPRLHGSSGWVRERRQSLAAQRLPLVELTPQLLRGATCHKVHHLELEADRSQARPVLVDPKSLGAPPARPDETTVRSEIRGSPRRSPRVRDQRSLITPESRPSCLAVGATGSPQWPRCFGADAGAQILAGRRRSRTRFSSTTTRLPSSSSLVRAVRAALMIRTTCSAGISLTNRATTIPG